MGVVGYVKLLEDKRGFGGREGGTGRESERAI